MASFKSILSDIGNTLKKVFSIGVEVAKAAEPIVDIAFPGFATLFNATVNEVAAAETAAIAAGAQSGTGAQKLAAVVAAITPTFNAYLVSNGIPAQSAATVEKYVQAVVDALNAIPAANS